MPLTTVKGFPYPELTDSPDGATQIQNLAQVIDDALTGTNGQVLTFDSADPNDVLMKWPKARTGVDVTAMTSATEGDVAYQSSGGETEALFAHNGTAFVRVGPTRLRYTRTERLALTPGDGDLAFDTDWDQWFGWSAARARWEFLAPLNLSGGASIGATPAGLLNTTDLYTGLEIVNRSTADPAVAAAWVVTDVSPVTYVQIWRTGTQTPDDILKLPRGLVAVATTGSLNQTSITTVVDVTGLVTPAFTCVSGRLYQVKAQFNVDVFDTDPPGLTEVAGTIWQADALQIGVAGWLTVGIITGTEEGTFRTTFAGESAPGQFTGSQTFKAKIQRTAGAGTVTVRNSGNGSQGWIGLYDVGAV